MQHIRAVKKQELRLEKELEKSLHLPHDWIYYEKLVSQLNNHFKNADSNTDVNLFFKEIQNQFFERQLSLHEVMYIMYCYGELLQDHSWFDQLQNLGHKMDESMITENDRY